MEDDILEFNFWPSFADLMLALVLVLVLLLFLFTAIVTVGTVNFEQVEKNQRQVIDSIAAAYNIEPKQKDKNVFEISITGASSRDIEIRNEPPLQKITFSDRIIFIPNDYTINEDGRAVLKIVGEALKTQLPNIREIQIQGHADTDPTMRFPSNTHLAALRAIEVLRYLQDVTGIDPTKQLMSATSFGEFAPVQRALQSDYSREKLSRDNSTIELKARNRRIELLLFYRV
jgi:flagellar motor protein MotB